MLTIYYENPLPKLRKKKIDPSSHAVITILWTSYNDSENLTVVIQLSDHNIYPEDEQRTRRKDYRIAFFLKKKKKSKWRPLTCLNVP